MRRTKTDLDGLFTFTKLPACDLTLTASYPGYVDGVFGQSTPGLGLGRLISLGQEQTIQDLKFRIAKAGAISGRVLGPYGDPATGVRVEALRKLGDTEPLRIAGEAICDDRGEFRVFGLPPGEYFIRALPAGPVAAEDYLVLVGLGTATQGDLARAVNSLLDAQRKRAQSRATTGADPVSPLAAIFYPSSGTVQNAQRLSLGIGDNLSGIELRLQLLRTVNVEGTITNSGQPIPIGTQVSLANAGVCCATTNVNADGTFVLRGIVPGEYTVRAWSPGGAQLQNGRFVGESLPAYWASSRVFADGIAAVTLNLSRGVRVAGTVQSDGATFPFPPAGSSSVPVVSLSLVRDETDALPPIKVQAVITPPGLFEFQGVPPGRYNVDAFPGPFRLFFRNAMSNGRDVLDTGLDVPPFGQVPDLTLVFGSEVSFVSGAVVGAPAASSGREVYVVVFPPEEVYWSAASRRVKVVIPDDAGHFSFEGLPPGDYRIAAFAGLATGPGVDALLLRRLSASATSFLIRSGERTSVSVIVR